MYWIVIQWVIQSKVFKIKWVETFKIKWVRVFKIKWVRVRLFTHVVLFSVLYVLLFLLNVFLMYVIFAVVSVCISCWNECGGYRVQYDIIGWGVTGWVVIFVWWWRCWCWSDVDSMWDGTGSTQRSLSVLCGGEVHRVVHVLKIKICNISRH